MSLFTSSSKRIQRTPKPLLLFLAVNLLASLGVWLVPWKGAGYFQDLCVQTAKADPREIILMGDSKVFPFVEGTADCPFFEQPAYAFAMDSATVLYQRILFDRLVREANLKPKIVFYSTGANNFAEEGLHVQRDYAMRFLARPKDLAGYAGMPGAFPYLVDSFFARVYPVYGRRIEITHLMFRGYKPRTIDLSPPERDPVADENYLLIYKRSVLSDFRVSEFHLANLEKFAQEVRAAGSEFIVLDLPVTEEMRDLETALCPEWDAAMAHFVERNGVRYLDLRAHHDFPFRDINHLSNLGAKQVTEKWLTPLVKSPRADKGE
jgi:hypothetical protein